MTSTQMRFISLATVALINLCGGRCFADVIAFDNLGANQRYTKLGVAQGSSDSEEDMLAQRFTAKVGGRMTKIETGMNFNVPGIASPRNLNVDDLTLSVVRDDNGKPGTQVLWSQNYIDNVPTGWGRIASFNVEGGPTLETGSKYWVVSRSTSIGRAPHTWYMANRPVSEPYAVYYFRSNIFTTGEWVVGGVAGTPPRLFERTLRVTVIPEPAAAALMIVASATLLAVRRQTVSL